MVTTDHNGYATWTLPGFTAPPIVAATPVNPNPGGSTTVTVTIEQVTAAHVTVRVWQTRPLLGLGLLPMIPTGAGVQVHLTATPATNNPTS